MSRIFWMFQMSRIFWENAEEMAEGMGEGGARR